MELVDDDVGGVDGEGNALAVALFTDATLDVDGELETVKVDKVSTATLMICSNPCTYR